MTNQGVKREAATCVHDITIHSATLKQVDKVREIFNGICKKYAFQLEKGEKTGKLHFQCRVSLRERMRNAQLASKLRSNGLESVHCSTTSNCNKDNDFYVLKDDTRVSGPYTDANYIFICDDVAKMTTLDPYQQDIIDMGKVPCMRSINVFYQCKGGVGKTSTVKYGRTYHGWGRLYHTETYTQLMQMACQIGRKEVYVCDMPRAIGNKMAAFFSAIETIKGGELYDPRYGHKDIMMNRPHIFIFTNHIPDLSMLSADMWKLWKINEKTKKLEKYIPPTQGIEMLDEEDFTSEEEDEFDNDWAPYEVMGEETITTTLTGPYRGSKRGF